MTAITSHLSGAELEARYETAADPVAKSHFHAVWLLFMGYKTQEVAEILSFSPRWVQRLLKRYNEQGPDSLELPAAQQRHGPCDPDAGGAGVSQRAAQSVPR